MSPRTLIIILCYNGVTDTLACLASLRRAAGSFDVLVVDNASSDGTPRIVREQAPGVTVIETGANLGFAAGNNVGLRYGVERGYDYLLLLNNDTEVAPDFLERMLAPLEQDPRIGAAGPTIYYYAQPDLIWSAGGTVDWKQGVARTRGGEVDAGQYPAVNQVEFVTGCALLVRRAAVERAGMLDERFFMYYEETEWCVRIGRAGFQIVHVPDSHVWHKIPLNARADKEYLAYYMTRNRLLFLSATRAPLRAWLHALVLQDLRTYLSLTLRPKWRHRAGRAGMRQAWMDFWRRRYGALSTQI